MSKKYGLGKGLGALIPNEIRDKEVLDKKEDNSSNRLISLNKIINNFEQPRKFFDNENIAE